MKLALAVALAALLGCSPKPKTTSSAPATSSAPTTQPDPSAAPAALFAVSWRLVELSGKPIAASPAPSLAFDRQGARVHGDAGCNTFTGTFAAEPGNRLRFSKLAATLKACPDMSVEQEFLKALETTDGYFVDRGHLVLHRARMAPLARFEPLAAKPK